MIPIKHLSGGVMIHKLIICLFILYSVSINAKQVDRVEHISVHEKLALIANMYNYNIYTAESLVNFVSKSNKGDAAVLSKHLANKKTLPSTKFPQLMIKNDYLVFKEASGPEIRFMPMENGSLKAIYQQNTTEINISMPLGELGTAFENLLAPQLIKQSRLDVIFSNAYAGDIKEAAGILFSSFAIDFASLGKGLTYAAEEVEISIRKKIRNYKQDKIVNDSIEACNDLTDGKKVKDTDKLIAKLENLKAEISCVTYWPKELSGSCAYYDEKIACLSMNLNQVNNSQRSSIKPNQVQPYKSTESRKDTAK